VGQCGPDNATLSRFLSRHFDVEMIVAKDWNETQEHLKKRVVDLVLINRKLDVDYSDGTNILSAIKANPAWTNLPVMIVSNYEEVQQKAVEMGAEPGFGKLELDFPKTLDKLIPFLGRRPIP
jgi:two-component system chemotaxis response regulator CheY